MSREDAVKAMSEGIIKGKRKSRILFSKVTDKNIYWAEFGLEYVGG